MKVKNVYSFIHLNYNPTIVDLYGRRDTNKITLQSLPRRYLWLHRIHISAILFVIINVASKLLKTLEIALLFFPALIIYLILPKAFDSVFQFSKGFYVWTFAIAIAVVFAGGGAAPHSKLALLSYIGTQLILVLFFIAFNSLFILLKVFKWDIRNEFSRDKKEATK